MGFFVDAKEQDKATCFIKNYTGVQHVFSYSATPKKTIEVFCILERLAKANELSFEPFRFSLA